MQKRSVHLQMNFLGISAGFHDAALSLLGSSGNILFAGHSERYSKKKNDKDLHHSLINECVSFGPIQTIAYYEKPFLKQLRRAYAGQGIEPSNLTTKQVVEAQMKGLVTTDVIKSYSHHLSHAAAGFQTSEFDRATVVVIDAIGEWDTVSIWAAEYIDQKAHYKKLWSKKYPHSIGLFYSAITKHVGLKPLEEEYILMGMSAYGSCDDKDLLSELFLEDDWNLTFKKNLHLGIDQELTNWHKWDIACSTQKVLERLVCNVMDRAAQFSWSKNLVYMGGVALNCVANNKLFDYFNNVWIMPNPGDAGSSLGAAALAYGKKVNWNTPYLGHNIVGSYPVDELMCELLSNKIVGVASGRAEFGPRALGNRSLLADPRGKEIKTLVNDIKKREQFRPFAPVILEELADQYFDMPARQSRYMQFVARCKQPDLYPAIVHVDNTSRVQTVARDGSGIRQLLERWYAVTGCPMLLNTSLNIKGEPMVNDRSDADRFERYYNVRVFS